MRQHLLVEPDPWRLTGLIGFEPAMRGGREYEFAAVGVFFTQGDAGLLRRTLASYGHDLDDGLSRRLLCLAAAAPVQLPALVLPPPSRAAGADP
jgi:hygromycin-B 7''-O-kinase